MTLPNYAAMTHKPLRVEWSPACPRAWIPLILACGMAFLAVVSGARLYRLIEAPAATTPAIAPTPSPHYPPEKGVPGQGGSPQMLPDVVADPVGRTIQSLEAMTKDRSDSTFLAYAVLLFCGLLMATVLYLIHLHGPRIFIQVNELMKSEQKSRDRLALTLSETLEQLTERSHLAEKEMTQSFVQLQKETNAVIRESIQTITEVRTELRNLSRT